MSSYGLSLLVTTMFAVSAVRAGGTDTPTLSQNWTLSLPHPHHQFYTSSSPSSSDKSSGPGRGYLGLPVGQYPGALGRHNLLPMAGPPGAFYKSSQFQDKSSFRTGVGGLGFVTSPGANNGAGGLGTAANNGAASLGTAANNGAGSLGTAANNGAVSLGTAANNGAASLGFATGFAASNNPNSGKSVQGFSYTPRLPNTVVQDPIQSRLGGFSFPQNAPITTGHRFFAAAAGFPPGFYGVKNPPGHNFALPLPQNLRGSRVFDNISYKPRDPTKKTGVYVVPTPSKLYFDGVKN